MVRFLYSSSKKRSFLAQNQKLKSLTANAQSRQPALDKPNKSSCSSGVQTGGLESAAVGSGLQNLGNSCYLNSILQVLYHTPEFVNFLIENEHRDCRHAHLYPKKIYGTAKNEFVKDEGCLICALIGTFRESKHSTVIAPTRVHSRIKIICRNFEFDRQEDAHECFVSLLDAINLCYSLLMNPQYPIIKLEPLESVFGGVKNDIVTCKCPIPHEMRINESMFEIQIYVNDQEIASISDGIADFFKPKAIADVKCTDCQTIKNRKVLIERPPKVLCIRVNRFGALGQKIIRPIDINLELNLTPHSTSSDIYLYRLIGVVCHEGSNYNSGHYTALARTGNNFHFFNDGATPTPVLSADINSDENLSNNIYIALYERLNFLSAELITENHTEIEITPGINRNNSYDMANNKRKSNEIGTCNILTKIPKVDEILSGSSDIFGVIHEMLDVELQEGPMEEKVPMHCDLLSGSCHSFGKISVVQDAPFQNESISLDAYENNSSEEEATAQETCSTNESIATQDHDYCSISNGGLRSAKGDGLLSNIKGAEGRVYKPIVEIVRVVNGKKVVIKPKTTKKNTNQIKKKQKAGTQKINKHTQHLNGWTERWTKPNKAFEKKFTNDQFGHACDVCDRLWFKSSLKKINSAQKDFLSEWLALQTLKSDFEFKFESVQGFMLCSNCYTCLRKNKIPPLARWNGFFYPEYPHFLPLLDVISARLISPRLPFMQIRRLRYNFSYGILGQVINVPVDVDNMVYTLPRQLDDDYAINVNIKRRLLQKSSYLKGYVRKETIIAWLEFLQNTTLYKQLKIEVDLDRLRALPDNQGLRFDIGDGSENVIEEVDDESLPPPQFMVAQQHTVVWNETCCLNIAPGENKVPLNIIYDNHAEELSFPSIYLGAPRRYRDGINVTHFMKATSEIRRKDRRGCAYDHILYMGVKIMRYRMVEGIKATFRNSNYIENVTRKMLEDPEFLEMAMKKDFAFLKSIPNSVQYWASKKLDLFAMILQLGKPTMFLTVSANETGWLDLLQVLFNLRQGSGNRAFDNINFSDLNMTQKTTLVCDDPVTCCIYFKKKLDALLKILCSKTDSPFGKHYVLDYFVRIEFQNRGSPHAHILLWLNDDPKEKVSEHMPKTIELIDSLVTVKKCDLPDPDMYNHQTHKHTFTCTKRGEESCRFNIPFFPSDKTCVLIPLGKEDKRRSGYLEKVKKIRLNLENRTYESMADFFSDNGILSYDEYFDLVRASITRPTVLLRRNIDEIFINPFNSWVAGTLNSNMDIQFILDEYSCANYVVEYVNKSNRGFGDLRKKIIDLRIENPDADDLTLIKKISKHFLNTIEMSVQEVAWFLLRLPMCFASRVTLYIPTSLPEKRPKTRKTKKIMDMEELAEDSTDVWTLNCIEKYEDRPPDLEEICLAEFISEFNFRDKKFTRKGKPSIIRYNNYKPSDSKNYKREQVLLFVPFRNELRDVNDGDKFEDIFDAKEHVILEQRKKYQANIDIDAILAEVAALCVLNEDVVVTEDESNANKMHHHGDMEDNDDDLDDALNGPNSEPENGRKYGGITAISKIGRRQCMTTEEYCQRMRMTNSRQKEFILELIHRLHDLDSSPLQVFFTGPAGCGKTFTLNIVKDTVNRYSIEQNCLNNSYLVAASTGKAAVAINGTTVHSLFGIGQRRVQDPIAAASMHKYQELFNGVRCLILDEISMLSADILYKMNDRLQQITGCPERFGGINIILTGDIRQLGAVKAKNIFVSHVEGNSNILWQELQFFPLKEVVRQSDGQFSSLLSKIGLGEALTSAEMELIESRFRHKAWCETNKPDVTRLFHTNACVNNYNKRSYSHGKLHVSDNVITGCSSNKEEQEVQKKLGGFEELNQKLPFELYLVIGYPYVVTYNVDVSDCLVNGAVGELKYIQELSTEQSKTKTNPTKQIKDQNNKNNNKPVTVTVLTVLWLEFANKMIGMNTRAKYKHYLRGNKDISHNWVPIVRKTSSLTIEKGSKIKCTRTQFPIAPARALTVHKSQGSTYDEIVFEYSSTKIQRQLVYVALSRVTNIDGLFITTANDIQFKFGHGSKFKPTDKVIRNVRDELLRLEDHALVSIVDRATWFCSIPNDLLIFNINAQSLNSHAIDISLDPVLLLSDFLLPTETWMRNSDQIHIKDFECVAQCNRSIHENKAGGSAIYRRVTSNASFINIELCEELYISNDDICMGVVSVNGVDIIIGSAYIHPNSSRENVIKIIDIFVNTTISYGYPSMLCGDFNIDYKKNREFISQIEKRFNILCVNNSPTTKNNTCLDLTFVSNCNRLNVDIFTYVSYFSYHHPVLNKLNFMGD